MASIEEIELRVTALEKRWQLTGREQSTMRHNANIALGDVNERFDMVEKKHDLHHKETSQRIDELSQRVDALHDDNKALMLLNSQHTAAIQTLNANVALILDKLTRLAP